MAKMIRLTLGCKCGTTMQTNCEERHRQPMIDLFREAHKGPDCEPCLPSEAATIRRKARARELLHPATTPYDEESSKHLATAYRKGYKAREENLPYNEVNYVYSDRRTDGGHCTFSRAYRNAFVRGWAAADYQIMHRGPDELLAKADQPNLSTDADPSGEREINTV